MIDKSKQARVKAKMQVWNFQGGEKIIPAELSKFIIFCLIVVDTYRGHTFINSPQHSLLSQPTQPYIN